jgi:Flp pilus assembly protein TadD
MSKRSFVWLISAVLLSACAASSGPSGSGADGPNALNIADAAIAGGDPNMALSVSQSVLSNDPDDIAALVHEGDAYYALGRCPAAEAAYQRALEHDSKASAAETGLGRCLLKTNPRAADTAFSLAVQDDPGNARAWNDLGIARDLEGNFAGAVQPYQHALLTAPGDTDAEVNLGLSLALSGDGPQALQYLGPLATGQNATPKIREDYAAALVASGRNQEAKDVLSVDLPPDEVATEMSGFSALIAGALAPPPPPPPAPTRPAVTIAPVMVSAGAGPARPVAPTPPKPPAPLAAMQGGMAPGPLMAVATPAAPLAASQSHAWRHHGAPMAETMATDQPSSGSGGAAVQLGALNSNDEAEQAWQQMSTSYPSLFGGRQPEIKPATVNGRTYYRLRIGGFDSRADAAKFCGEVSAIGNACTVANF